MKTIRPAVGVRPAGALAAFDGAALGPHRGELVLALLGRALALRGHPRHLDPRVGGGEQALLAAVAALLKLVLALLELGGQGEAALVVRRRLPAALDRRAGRLHSRVEVIDRLRVFGVSLRRDRGLQHAEGRGRVGDVALARLFGLQPRHQRLAAGALLFQVLQVGLGEGGVQRRQHRTLLHHVAGVRDQAGDDGAVQGLHEDRPLGRQDAARAGHHLVQLHHRHEHRQRQHHAGDDIEDHPLVGGGGVLDDRLRLRLEGADRRRDEISAGASS